MRVVQKLWRSTDGAILTSELILLATLLAIGLIVGLSTLRNSIAHELGDAAEAVSHIHWGGPPFGVPPGPPHGVPPGPPHGVPPGHSNGQGGQAACVSVCANPQPEGGQ